MKQHPNPEASKHIPSTNRPSLLSTSSLPPRSHKLHSITPTESVSPPLTPSTMKFLAALLVATFSLAGSAVADLYVDGAGYLRARDAAPGNVVSKLTSSPRCKASNFQSSYRPLTPDQSAALAKKCQKECKCKDGEPECPSAIHQACLTGCKC